MDKKLYPMIFKRKSFHIFKDIGTILGEELTTIEKIFSECEPLIPDIKVGMKIVPAERIILAGWRDHDVQTLLMRCSLLITDYSSVFFDAGYMEKPVIYYQFDQEEFRKFHYQEGYFSYEKHGFGPVVQTAEALVEAAAECIGNDFRMQREYLDRLAAFYPVRDERNCERTYQILCRMNAGD